MPRNKSENNIPKQLKTVFSKNPCFQPEIQLDNQHNTTFT